MKKIRLYGMVNHGIWLVLIFGLLGCISPATPLNNQQQESTDAARTTQIDASKIIGVWEIEGNNDLGFFLNSNHSYFVGVIGGGHIFEDGMWELNQSKIIFISNQRIEFDITFIDDNNLIFNNQNRRIILRRNNENL